VSILVSYRPTYKNCFRVEYGPITRLKFIAYHKPILHYEEEPPLRSRIKQKYTKNLQVPQQQLHRANSSIFKRHRVCECTRTAFSALIVILVSLFYFLYCAILDSYRENLLALGDKLCSSCQEPASDSRAEVHYRTPCIKLM